jgi:hypothetical protein
MGTATCTAGATGALLSLAGRLVLRLRLRSPAARPRCLPHVLCAACRPPWSMCRPLACRETVLRAQPKGWPALLHLRGAGLVNGMVAPVRSFCSQQLRAVDAAVTCVVWVLGRPAPLIGFVLRREPSGLSSDVRLAGHRAAWPRPRLLGPLTVVRWSPVPTRHATPCPSHARRHRICNAIVACVPADLSVTVPVENAVGWRVCRCMWP